jgi:hypothetical protein
MGSPFIILVTIVQYPLPEGVKRYHFFRTKKTACGFYQRSDYACDIKALSGGATLLKPVALATLEYRGELYDCRREFPYESEPDDVVEAWAEHDVLGCDCTRSDLIAVNCDGAFKHWGMGRRSASAGA